MISLILVLFASILKACNNTLHEHFSTSVFRNLNPEFWNVSINQPRHINAHLVLRTIKISLLFFAVILYQPITDNVPIDVLLFGMVWSICLEVVSEHLYKH